MSKYQYRITYYGGESAITDFLPDKQWSMVCSMTEDHRTYAKLERRLVTTPDLLKLLTDPTGYIVVDEQTLVCPWEIMAEADYKSDS